MTMPASPGYVSHRLPVRVFPLVEPIHGHQTPLTTTEYQFGRNRFGNCGDAARADGGSLARYGIRPCRRGSSEPPFPIWLDHRNHCVGTIEIGSVEIHRELMTAAAR